VRGRWRSSGGRESTNQRNRLQYERRPRRLRAGSCISPCGLRMDGEWWARPHETTCEEGCGVWMDGLVKIWNDCNASNFPLQAMCCKTGVGGVVTTTNVFKHQACICSIVSFEPYVNQWSKSLRAKTLMVIQLRLTQMCFFLHYLCSLITKLGA
jgi:hypothetical protein